MRKHASMMRIRGHSFPTVSARLAPGGGSRKKRGPPGWRPDEMWRHLPLTVPLVAASRKVAVKALLPAYIHNRPKNKKIFAQFSEFK